MTLICTTKLKNTIKYLSEEESIFKNSVDKTNSVSKLCQQEENLFIIEHQLLRSNDFFLKFKYLDFYVIPFIPLLSA